MRKLFKNIGIVAIAGVLACGAAALSGCAYRFTPPSGGPSADDAVQSQGGFVVQKGEYVYFINGVQAYTEDNTYGSPVKGSLMRIRMSDIEAKKNTAETVIPSLMTAQDYSSGIFIYGDRVYYATPNNVGNMSGEVDKTWLDFKSAGLDGSDVRDLFRVSDNAVLYRFVEVDDTVYVVYEQDGSLISYNTSAETSVTLAEDVEEYVLNSNDKTDPYIYYTMGVSDAMDTEESAIEYSYNQVYRVSADATEAPYEYTWDETYLEEHDGEAPYVNLGTLVLDGIGRQDPVTQFNRHDDADNESLRPAFGYTYSLRAYANEGLYFVRTPVDTAGTASGSSGELYYLPVSSLGDEWDSIAGNGKEALDMVADSIKAAGDADDAAYFYIEEDAQNGVKHHYLYVKDSALFRVDVKDDGAATVAEELEVAYDVGEATIVSIDNTSDDTYDYVYYTRSQGSGLSVERAVYNGEEEDYRNLVPEGENHEPYRPVRVLELEHASGWYNYELLNGILFFADAYAFGSTSYNYVSAVDLRNDDGSLKNNEQLKAFNDRYGEIMDDEDGYLARLTEDGDAKLSTAISYYFYTGQTHLFEENIQEAVENGRRETYLYSEEEQQAFRDFAAGKGDAEAFMDGDESYAVYSYFVTRLGEMSEEDCESLDDYWRNVLQRDAAEASEETSLEAWEWALIGVAIGLVVAGGVVAAVLIVRKRRAQKTVPHEARMVVDTTDDRDVDVYAVREEPFGAEDPAAEGPAEAPAAPSVEKSAEEPAGDGQDEQPEQS